MDMKNELLEGLPAYKGGKMSLEMYNAGGGLYDERLIEDKPLPVGDGTKMSAELFSIIAEELEDKNGGKLNEKAPEGEKRTKVYFNNRWLQLKHKDGTVKAYFTDDYVPCKEDKSSFVRTVIKTKKEEFLSYINGLVELGFSITFENEIENNIYRELFKDGRLIFAAFTGNDGTARFVDDKVSVPVADFGSSQGAASEKTEVYQYALRQSVRVDGTVTDCGMNYVVKLSDDSLFLVDGGEYEQATDEAVENYYNFLKKITSTPDGEKIRIACWFCTHAHDDHLEFFSKLLRLYHKNIVLQRVMFNFTSSEIFGLGPQAYTVINRINKYYPEVKYLKPHSGQRFNLAGTEIQILQTHEDFTFYGGTEHADGFNDTSTVLKMSFDGESFIILGDINDGAEGMLLRHFSYKTLECSIIQAAHHLFNKLNYIYDVTSPQFVLVPSRPDTKVNHDRPKYERLLLSCKEENIFFGSEDGTHGFGVKNGKLQYIYHDILRGGDYDGSEL